MIIPSTCNIRMFGYNKLIGERDDIGQSEFFYNFTILVIIIF